MYLYMSTDFHAQRLVVMKTYTSWVGQMMNDHSLWDLVCANSANYTGIVTGLALGFPYIQQSQIFWAKKKKHDQPIGRARPQRFLDQLLRNLLSTSDTGRRTKISGCQLRTSNGQTTTRYFTIIVSKTGGSCMKMRDECYGVQSLSPRTSSILSPVVQLGFCPAPRSGPTEVHETD